MALFRGNRPTQSNVLVVLLLAAFPLAWAGQRIHSVQRQAELIHAIRSVPGVVEFHTGRFPASVWLQKPFVEQPIASVRTVTFDFEEHPDLSRFPWQQLVHLRDLEEFDVAVCGVTGDEFAPLAALPRLETLDVATTPQSARPGTHRPPAAAQIAEHGLRQHDGRSTGAHRGV